MTSTIPRPTNAHATPNGRASDAPNSRPANPHTLPTLDSPGGLDSPATIGITAPTAGASRGSKQADRHQSCGDQGSTAVGSSAPGPAAGAITTPTTEALLDPALSFAADILDDIESVRKANENRLRQMTRSVEDKDGEVRGLGYDESHPDVAWMASLVAMIGKAEHQAALNLERQLRRHPMYPWIRSRWPGGRKQVARLLAAIGDPYWRPEWLKTDGTVVPEGPRTISALWAYCGMHVIPANQGDSDALCATEGWDGRGTDHGRSDAHIRIVGAAPRRQRNQQSNWNETARMRLWNVADKAKQAGFDSQRCISMGASETGFAVHGEGCQCKPYRLVYDGARAKYADAVHATPCVRCGPKGKPAPVGTPLSDAHKNARAIRIVMKEILKDLWREAKRLHELHDNPGLNDVDDQVDRAGVVVPQHSGRPYL